MKINSNPWVEPGNKRQKTDIEKASVQKTNISDDNTDALDSKDVNAEPLEIDSVEITPANERESPDFKDEMQKMRDEWSNFKNQLDNAIEQSEGAAKEWKIKIQCLQIAMRIMRGDNVPIEDERFLADHDIELFTKAITLRVPKEDPEEYDRLSEDEEDESSKNSSSSKDSASLPVADDIPADAESAAADALV